MLSSLQEYRSAFFALLADKHEHPPRAYEATTPLPEGARWVPHKEPKEPNARKSARKTR